MSPSNEQSLRCTVHWIERDRQRRRDFLLPDRPIAALATALCETLGVREPALKLRPGPHADAWPVERRPSELGIRDGDQVWLLADTPQAPALTASPAASAPAALMLPGGTPIELGRHGVAITRRLLLQHLSWSERGLEQLSFWCGTSPYLAVSARATHCLIRPAGGAWSIVTVRHDVETWLNRRLLAPGQPLALGEGDCIAPGGASGPQLVFVYVDA